MNIALLQLALSASVIGAPAPTDAGPARPIEPFVSPLDEPDGSPPADEPPAPSEPAAEAPAKPEPSASPRPTAPAVSPPLEQSSAGTRAPATSVTTTRTATLPSSRPLRWRIDAALGLGALAIFDPAYRAFDDDDRTLFGLDIAIRGDRRLGRSRLFLGGGIAYHRFGSDGQPHDGALDTEVVVHEPVAFGRLSVLTVEGIDVFGELGAGPTFARVEVTSRPERADQRSITGTVAAHAGAVLYLPRRWLPRRGAARTTAGLELALGYVFRGALDIRPSPDVDDDAIPTQSVGFGDVALRGLSWRLGLFMRFM